MVDSPVPTVVYTVVYFIIVVLGPRCMKHRTPFKLTTVLIPYNVLMTLLNLYIAVEVRMSVAEWHVMFTGFLLLLLSSFFCLRRRAPNM